MKNHIIYPVAVIIISAIFCLTYYFKNNDFEFMDIDGGRILVLSKSTGANRIINIPEKEEEPTPEIMPQIREPRELKTELKTQDVEFYQDPDGKFQISHKWDGTNIKFRLKIESTEEYAKAYRDLDRGKTFYIHFYDSDEFPIAKISLADVERNGFIDKGGKLIGVTYIGSEPMGYTLYNEIAASGISWNFTLKDEVTRQYYQRGVDYFHGNGVKKDTKKAKELIKKAFDLGSDEAKKFWEEKELWNK